MIYNEGTLQQAQRAMRPPLRTHPLCRSDAVRGTIVVGGTLTNTDDDPRYSPVAMTPEGPVAAGAGAVNACSR
jgi:hypothetical protein